MIEYVHGVKIYSNWNNDNATRNENSPLVVLDHVLLNYNIQHNRNTAQWRNWYTQGT